MHKTDPNSDPYGLNDNDNHAGASLQGPICVHELADGRVVVLEQSGSSVRFVCPSSHKVTTLIGHGGAGARDGMCGEGTYAAKLRRHGGQIKEPRGTPIRVRVTVRVRARMGVRVGIRDVAGRVATCRRPDVCVHTCMHREFAHYVVYASLYPIIRTSACIQ